MDVNFFLQMCTINNGYYFATINTSNRYLFHEKNNKVEMVISPTIVASHKEEQYFFALRQPRTDINNEMKFRNECEFWIIDTDSDKIFGPLERNEYVAQIKKIGLCTKCLIWNTLIRSKTTYCSEREEINSLVEDRGGVP